MKTIGTRILLDQYSSLAESKTNINYSDRSLPESMLEPVDLHNEIETDPWNNYLMYLILHCLETF